MMVDDPVLPSLTEAFAVAYQARMAGARSFRLKCCAWGRPNRPYIFVHRCVARVVQKFTDLDESGAERDCLLVEFNVVDFIESYRRQALKNAADDAGANIRSNQRALKPIGVMRR